MKRHLLYLLVGLLAGLAILGSCLPRATPAAAPSPVPATPAIPVVPAAASTIAPSAEDVAWAKIVDAAKKEGMVNVYSYALAGDAGVAVSGAFKERYGITVENITGRGAAFFERLKTEKRMRQQVGDVILNTTVYTTMLKGEGLLASVGGELPALREKGVWWMDPAVMDPQDKANLVTTITVSGPYINTKLVAPDQVPQSWRDLLGPQWKGKMSLTDHNLLAGPYQLMVVLMDNKVVDEDYIRSLFGQKLSIYNGMQDEFLALARGEIHLTVRGNDGDAGRFIQEGAPIRPIDMKEGLVISSVGAGVIAGGPNSNAARLFLNWVFTAEGQTVLSKAQVRKMVRRDVPDFRAQALQISITKPLVETPQQLERAGQLFRERWLNKVLGR